jgi:hypothetical protein
MWANGVAIHFFQKARFTDYLSKLIECLNTAALLRSYRLDVSRPQCSGVWRLGISNRVRRRCRVSYAGLICIPKSGRGFHEPQSHLEFVILYDGLVEAGKRI